MNIAPSERPRVKSECLRLLATLRLDPARMKMISGFVDTYLKLNAAEQEIFKTEIAKFEPVKQEVVMKIVTSWQLEGKQEIIIRQLNRKVGAIAPELQEQILQLPNTQLEDLGEALLDFNSQEDLVNWLQGV
ncbi:hypothetical protein NIES37_28820 [Tolypothrix tenuis PCC 7101]|uniref:DUF4351 domain-containing protein n=1 Tax=Tolypothrix tenuis PCC 7101 TaxID=231146 RepID=A0A1Z4MZL0_9CYAN|nr:hypothetical protein NIES37_28820 [Tolypothrix tenuis PCC 7101]BAZ77177.1 hypothetical protein NIES50_57800 [Aulosira laxa NIES-50]